MLLAFTSKRNSDLLTSIMQCDLASVRALLETGSNPNTVNKSGASAILIAIQKEFYHGTEALIQAGADISDGKALLCAVKQPAIVNLLLKHHSKVDKSKISEAFHKAFSDEEHDTVKVLIPYVKMSDRNCIINLVAREGHTMLLKQLIKYGVDLEIGDIDFGTPFLNAVKHGQRPCMKILIDSGCNINHVNKLKKSALMYAVQIHSIYKLQCIKTLLIAGCDIRQRDKKHKSALQYAMLSTTERGPDLNCVKLLHAAGANSKDIHDYILSELFSDYNQCTWNEAFQSSVLQIIIEEHQTLLPLTSLCRRLIRKHLLKPSGADQNNLLMSAPLLPLPTRLKNYLLYNVDITNKCTYRTDPP